MRRLLSTALILLVPVVLAGAAGAASGTDTSVAAQQNGDQEHPEGEEEHPKGEEEHPKGEEHPEGEAEEHPEGEEDPEGEAEEHPDDAEHPEAEGEEHPEEAAIEPLTIDQLADAIDEWVATESAANGGFLTIEHPETGETLQLTLDHVHRERLSHIGDQTYFACADFVDGDGTVYDLDVFMQGPTAEALQSTDVTLHKVSGDARYTWFEEDGVWKKQPAS